MICPTPKAVTSTRRSSHSSPGLTLAARAGFDEASNPGLHFSRHVLYVHKRGFSVSKRAMLLTGFLAMAVLAHPLDVAWAQGLLVTSSQYLRGTGLASARDDAFDALWAERAPLTAVRPGARSAQPLQSSGPNGLPLFQDGRPLFQSFGRPILTGRPLPQVIWSRLFPMSVR